MKTNTKIKNAVLTAIGLPSAYLAVAEVEDNNFWWIPYVAFLVLFIVVKIALGGKNEAI